MKLLRRGLTQPAADQISPNGLPVGPLPEMALEEGRRLIEDGKKPLAPSARLIRMPASYSSGRESARPATRSHPRSRAPPSRTKVTTSPPLPQPKQW